MHRRFRQQEKEEAAPTAILPVKEEISDAAHEGSVIILNVGGQKFSTTLDTLRKYPNTPLGIWFCEHGDEFPPSEFRYETGCPVIFFDQDPSWFQEILSLYRGNKVYMDNTSTDIFRFENVLNIWKIPFHQTAGVGVSLYEINSPN